jgi:hypothetical protein
VKQKHFKQKLAQEARCFVSFVIACSVAQPCCSLCVNPLWLVLDSRHYQTESASMCAAPDCHNTRISRSVSDTRRLDVVMCPFSVKCSVGAKFVGVWQGLGLYCGRGCDSKRVGKAQLSSDIVRGQLAKVLVRTDKEL